ncbi:Lipopeptide precursor [compost metagenome]
MLYYKDFTMKRLLTALIALVAITSLLTGCGQKGPLYLPDDGKTAQERDRDIFL